MLEKQDDVKIIEIKDYFKNPKPNGYRSYHMIVEVPVFFSDYKEFIRAELQIRTIAMDFWASLNIICVTKNNKLIQKKLEQNYWIVRMLSQKQIRECKKFV